MSMIENSLEKAEKIMNVAKAQAEKEGNSAVFLALSALYEQNLIVIDLLRDLRHRTKY